MNVQRLLDQQFDALSIFIYDELKVPESFVWQDVIGHFLVKLYESSISIVASNDEVERLNREIELERYKFLQVCDSVPNVPVPCLEFVSLALGALVAENSFVGIRTPEEEDEFVGGLLNSEYAMGIAIGLKNPSDSLEAYKSRLKQRKRVHYLDHVIDAAIGRCSDSKKPGSVWVELVEMARSRSHGLIGVTPKGVQYLDANDEQKEFSKKQLTAYLTGSNLRRDRPRKPA